MDLTHKVQVVLKIAYKPSFSAKFIALLKYICSPEMIHHEGESEQYELDHIKEELDINGREDISNKDSELLDALIKQNFNYIEI